MIPEYGGNLANIADIAIGWPSTSPISAAATRCGICSAARISLQPGGADEHLDSMSRPRTIWRSIAPRNCSFWRRAARSSGDRDRPRGTRQIYGRPDYLPVDERHVLRPVDVQRRQQDAGRPTTAVSRCLRHQDRLVRLTNVYGRNADQGRAPDFSRHLAGAESSRANLRGLGGEQRGDLLYVDDAADAFLYAAITPQPRGWRSCRRRRVGQPRGSCGAMIGGEWRGDL